LQGLITTKLDDNDYDEIRQFVKGILFLATPHQGLGSTKYLEVLTNVINFAIAGPARINGRLRIEFVEILSKNSDALWKIAVDFRNQMSSIKIVSFLEQSTTPPLKKRASDRRCLDLQQTR